MKSFISWFSVMLLLSSSLLSAYIFESIKQGNEQVVLEWLDQDPDLSVVNQDGQSTLIYAVIHKQFNILVMLRAAGVDKDIVDHFGKTARDYALDYEEEQARLEYRNRVIICSMFGAIAALLVGGCIYDYCYRSSEETSQDTKSRYESSCDRSCNCSHESVVIPVPKMSSYL